MKNALKITSLLVLTLAAWWFWHTRPSQIVHRQIDALIDLGYYKKIALDTRAAQEEDIASLFAPRTEVTGSSPVPSGTLSHADLAQALQNFQLYLRSCELSERDRRIDLTDGVARVILPLRAQLVLGDNSSREEDFTLMLELQKTAQWRITRLEFKDE
ncbi:MAG: hypothetical protein ACQKBY_10535 [Verrucomicrobiales bacterium]